MVCHATHSPTTPLLCPLRSINYKPSTPNVSTTTMLRSGLVRSSSPSINKENALPTALGGRITRSTNGIVQSRLVGNNDVSVTTARSRTSTIPDDARQLTGKRKTTKPSKPKSKHQRNHKHKVTELFPCLLFLHSVRQISCHFSFTLAI